MRSRIRRSSVLAVVVLLSVPIGWTPLASQERASPVRFTEAKEYPVRRTVRLPGSVESSTSSVVASEVPGLVQKLEAREGQTVKTGQILAVLRSTNLELRKRALEAQLEEARSRLKLAEINLERARGLFEQEVASQQDFDNAMYEHAAWRGRVDDLTAQIAQVQLGIDLCTIRAPFAGMVAAERTEVGQWIAEGGPVIELISLAELEVLVEVPERYYGALAQKAKATVTLDALPGVTLEGRITAIVARADPEARTFPIKVSLRNTDGRIGVGMLAQVSFPAGESYRATVVPKDAVVRQGEGEFVYRINGEQTIDMIPVTTGEGVGSWIVVNGDLTAGQRIVTRGNERLFPGMKVSGEPLEYALP